MRDCVIVRMLSMWRRGGRVVVGDLAVWLMWEGRKAGRKVQEEGLHCVGLLATLPYTHTHTHIVRAEVSYTRNLTNLD